MDTFESFRKELYSLNDSTFADIALNVFRFQAYHNPVYASYIRALSLNPENINSLNHIPFLPISFFKTRLLKSSAWRESTIFTSSGTTGATTSTHYIQSLEFYLNHAEKCFEQFFGALSDYHILALLPSYLERSHSSLVAMIDHFIKRSGSIQSGFYLHNVEQLLEDVERLRRDKRKTILWGVTFALLDIAEKFQPDFSHCIIFETGGMKGRRKEITREELHDRLKAGLNVSAIYSEYGMTELLSQAYTKGGARFFPSKWMKVIGRDITDPFEMGLLGQTCALNVIDLANHHSIAFIETEDIGKIYEDGSFEVLGRLDNSDVRGCNLLVE